MANSQAHQQRVGQQNDFFDAVVVGAGFSGLYMLHKLRSQGLSVRLFEAGADVGGTWYWNRYPGARCDVESVNYSYSFSEELQQEWTWQERYPAQPEILRYLQHVADRFGLRRDIVFNTKITAADYDEATDTWTVRPETGTAVVGRFCIMATGCLSVPKTPDLPGLDTFEGPAYHTADWPESDVDFAGQRVGVFGTGSSGVQAIPVLAQRADHLTVFQRTPAFSVPARNHPLDDEYVRAVKANYPERRRIARDSATGQDFDQNEQSALDVDAEQRHREYSERWNKGGPIILGAYSDLLVDQEANDTVSDFIRMKIRETVEDHEVAEKLIPTGFPFGSKRPCYDTGYYETYNRDNVLLVDLRKDSLKSVTPTGVQTSNGHHELDSIVLATGFDAMTGALNRIDIRGRGGATLADKWSHGPRTFLGLGSAGFPNLFILAGPGSPSVLTNMVTAIEQHVEWTADCIEHLRTYGYRSIEPSVEAEDEWVDHVNDVADQTLFPQADSWYLGANVSGKTRIFMPYAGGMNVYEEKCNEVAGQSYHGFVLK